MKNLLKNNILYLIMALFSLVGFAVYLYDKSSGSWLMGIGAGIALGLTLPILREIAELSTPLENDDDQ